MPARITGGDLLRPFQFLRGNGALDIRDRLPALNPVFRQIDETLINRAVLARDDKRAAGKGLVWPPFEHRRFVGLVEIDQGEAGFRIGIAGLAERRDDGRDLVGGERIERMRRDLVTAADNLSNESEAA